MNAPGPESGFLSAYTQALLRWNRTMSLVSRQDSERVAEHLVQQCVHGGQALWVALDEKGWLPPGESPGLHYFDLGSGGGLPGLVWHHLFSRTHPHLSTCLVEPREKRAWFLRRHSELAGTPAHQVLEAAWGDEPCPGLEGPIDLAVISLKALHLTDHQILAGLGGGGDSGSRARVVVARYYPGSQTLDAGLKDHLGLPVPGLEIAGWRHEGAEVLTWPASRAQDASLVLSLYI